MKKILPVYFFVFLGIDVLAQGSFVRQFQAGDYSQGAICQLVNGNFVALHRSYQWNQYSEGVLLIDDGFNISQHSLLNSLYYNSLRRIYPTSDSGYFVLGSFFEKVDRYGNVQFMEALEDSAGAQICFLDGVQTKDGGYMLTGFAGNSNADYKYVIIKLDSSGYLSWIKSSTFDYAASAFVLSLNADSTVTIHTYKPNEKSVVMKFDLAGNIVWTKNFDGGSGPNYVLINDLPLNDGYIIGAGASIMRTDSALSPQWRRSYVHNGNLINLSQVTMTKDGDGFLLSGYYTIGNWSKPVLIKTNSSGQPLWGRMFEHIRTISGFCEADDADRSILLTGDSLGGHLLLFKLDSTGACCISNSIFVTSASEPLPIVYNYNPNCYTEPVFPVVSGGFQSTTIPVESDYCLSLYSDDVYAENIFSFSPNPTSSTFTIKTPIQFQIGDIGIYNLLGEKVSSKQLESGNKEIRIDVSNLTPGLYFIKLQTEKGTSVQKLIIQ